MTWVRQHRFVTAIVAVAVVLVAVVATVWISRQRIADEAADNVSAYWNPVCTPGTLTERADGSFRLKVRPNWSCTLTLTIVNDGSRSIHVSGIEAPFLGSQAGAEIVGLSSSYSKIRDDTRDPTGGIDAIYSADLDIRPHSQRSIKLAVGWRKTGCTGATTTFFGWPTVVFEVDHLTRRRAANQNLVLVPDTQDPLAPGCAQQ